MPKTLVEHLVEIRRGGFGVIRRKGWSLTRRLPRALLVTASTFWALPLALAIRAVRPIVLIKVGPIHAHRIGHFVPDSSALVMAAKARPSRQWDLYYLLPRQTSNLQWEKMVRRELSISGWWLEYVDVWNMHISGSRLHHRPNSANTSRDTKGIFARGIPPIDFLDEENRKALDWLKSLGWSANEPFVCLQVRDDQYLARDPRFGRGDQQSFDNWAYHSYRNSEISTYLDAIRWLLDQGIWVFRMGRIMRERIPFTHPHLVDYSFRDDTSDFLDVWLFANASGTISTSSGPDWVSGVYGVPLLIINLLPISHVWSSSRSLHVPKSVTWLKSGTPLTLTEHLGLSMEDFQRGNPDLEIHDLNSEEIKQAVMEFWARVEGSWIAAKDDVDLQESFWRQFLSWSQFEKLHGWKNPEALMGTQWLRNQARNFLDEPPIIPKT